MKNKMKELEDIISDLQCELEFLSEKYSEIPLQSLYESVGSLEELLENRFTTPFSDDLGTEDDNNLEKLKIAAQIIKIVIKDEEEKTGCTKYKAVDKIFTYLRTLIY